MTTARPPTRRSLLIMLSFLAFVRLGQLGVSWPCMGRDFGVPLDDLGLLATFGTAGYLTASFLSGRILRAVPIGAVLARLWQLNLSGAEAVRQAA